MNPNAYIEMSKDESNHWWFMGRREICKTIIRKITNAENLKILEVGCGTGGNLDFLSGFGNVSAFEMDPVALSLAKQKNPNCNILQGSCPSNIPYASEKFDLICLFDVLEHIEDDEETLKILKNMLKENGVLILTVPAYQWLYGPHDKFLHHKRRYTLTKLCELAKFAGLKTSKASYFNTFLFPIAAIARVKDKLSSNEQSTGTNKPQNLINKFLYAIFSMERHFLKRINFHFGVSIIGVFTK